MSETEGTNSMLPATAYTKSTDPYLPRQH